MLPGDMGRTGRQWNVISEPYPGLRGYATAYSWNPLRKGLLTGIYVLPNSSRFFSMRFTPLNSRIFLHLNPRSHLLSNLKGRRLQIYLRPFSWLILRLRTAHMKRVNLREKTQQVNERAVTHCEQFLASVYGQSFPRAAQTTVQVFYLYSNGENCKQRLEDNPPASVPISTYSHSFYLL